MKQPFFDIIEKNFQAKEKEFKEKATAVLLKFNGLEDFYNKYMDTTYTNVPKIDYETAMYVIASDPILAVKAYKRYENPILLRSIISSIEASFYYAEYLGERFVDGEPTIATSAEYSFRYAYQILNRQRFELGEKIIATSPKYSCKYALDVIEGRFELGEEAISSDVNYSYEYYKSLRLL